MGEFFTTYPYQKLMNALGRPIFVGQHQRSLDSKNRLTIPSKWRFDGDTEDVFLAFPDPSSGAIHVLPPSRVQKLMELMESQSLSDEDVATLQDKLFSQAHSFGCDKQGRVNLTEELLAHAGISKEAVVVGRLSDFRIWSPERWTSVDPKANNDDMGKIMKLAGI